MIREMFNLSEISATQKKASSERVRSTAEGGVGILDREAKNGLLSQVYEDSPEDR